MSKNSSILSGKPMTRAQEAKLADNIIAVLRKLNPSSDDAQRIITRSNELTDPLIERFIDLGRMRYKSEEVASAYGYPQRFVVKPICEQLLALKDYALFQKLNSAPALNCARTMAQRPEGADGNFVMPWWRLIGKTYAEATERVIGELVRVHNMKNWLEKHLTENHIRQYEPSRQALEALHAKQPGDFLVFAAQLGILHHGKSIRRAREVFGPKEFGLGPYEVGITLLTHPERLARHEDLFIDCPGAEYDYDAGGRFPFAPGFVFYDGQPHFNGYVVNDPDDFCGSASAFSPQ